MPDRSLDDVAKRFDDVFTRLTLVQKRLLAATRSCAEDESSARDLMDEALTLIAAFDAGTRAVTVGIPPRHEMEAEALRARVLTSPVDGHLLMAAARSQARQHAFPLLADAIAMRNGEGFWDEWTVVSIMRSPIHMGESRARWLAKHVNLEPHAAVSHLTEGETHRLIEALREFADHLPAEASGRPMRAKLPDDGAGAGADILRRWVDPLGRPTDPLREVAWEAAMRPGWPTDAVGVMELLVEFTHRRVLPVIVPDFTRILRGHLSHDDLMAALRAEERAYRDAWRGSDDGEDDLQLARSMALERDIVALQALRKARAQMSLPRDERRGKSPLVLAREAARRCGEALACLACLGDDVASELLEELPTQSPTVISVQACQ
jgi:hypothetical protein